MNSFLGNVASCLALFWCAAAYGEPAMPAIDVVVSKPDGKVAYKGTTNPNGTFATGLLERGHYVVQFNAQNQRAIKGQYALVVSAGKRKVSATAVAGEKFSTGGVAMRIEVGNASTLAGQVAPAGSLAAQNESKAWLQNIQARAGEGDRIIPRTMPTGR